MLRENDCEYDVPGDDYKEFIEELEASLDDYEEEEEEEEEGMEPEIDRE